MKIFTRLALVPAELPIGTEALLLEGSWPPALRSLMHWSLDGAIDARHAWIDVEAARLADRIAGSNSTEPVSGFAWRNAVRLRYFLVKLLRVVAFLTEQPATATMAALELHLDPTRDEVYYDLLAAIAVRQGFAFDVNPSIELRPTSSSRQSGREAWWRRGLGRLAAMIDRRPPRSGSRVLLCGNPRLLEPVCGELVRRRVASWWLGERFAPRTWARWRWRCVGFATCDAAEFRVTAESQPFNFSLPDDLACRGVDLQPAVERWLARTAADCELQQAAQRRAIEAVFHRLRPTHVVLDQDGTPLARMIVAAARSCGARTGIVQHGAPYVRFGFAPLEADCLFAWGETSRRQFLDWQIDDERIVVTGTTQSPLPCLRPIKNSNAPRFLLLATLAPRDDRPDVVGYHLTLETYAGMLRTACEAVSQFSGAKLVVKLHPRDLESEILRSIVADFPRLARVLGAVSLARSLEGIDCVLSCASSAGIEAAAWGWPVVQLMPDGSHDLLPPESWGLVGSATDREQLVRLMRQALAPRATTNRPNQHVLAASGAEAARRIVDALLDPNFSPPPFDDDRTIPTAAPIARRSVVEEAT